MKVKVTENYIKHQKIVSKISITDMVKVVECVEHLADLLGAKADSYEIDTILEPLYKVIEEADIGHTCLNCGSALYMSDLPLYDFVCVQCDENF